MDFGERLKQLRNEYKITQKQLAKTLGVGRPTIAGYETKGIQPSYETLNKIADYFKVSTDYLLGRTDEKKYPIAIPDLIKTAEEDKPYETDITSKNNIDIEDIDNLSKDSKKDLKTYIEFLKIRQKQYEKDNPTVSKKDNIDYDIER